jgi:hypothetical protein
MDQASQHVYRSISTTEPGGRQVLAARHTQSQFILSIGSKLVQHGCKSRYSGLDVMAIRKRTISARFSQRARLLHSLHALGSCTHTGFSPNPGHHPSPHPPPNEDLFVFSSSLASMFPPSDSILDTRIFNTPLFPLYYLTPTPLLRHIPLLKPTPNIQPNLNPTPNTPHSPESA